MKKAPRKRGNLFWMLIFLNLALVLLAIYLAMQVFPNGEKTAYVYSDGALVQTLPLNEDTQITIKSPNGGENALTVRGGKIAVTESDCKNQICVHTGAVQSGTIICAPNKLVIIIKSTKAQDYDLQTG